MEVVRRIWDAWERRDSDAAVALYHPEIEWEQTANARGGPGPGIHRGVEGIRRWFRDWLEAFDDYYAHAEEFIDAGENVVVRLRQGGRGKGSGVSVEMPAFWQVYRLRAGRVVRIEIYSDRSEALEAAGLPE